MGANIPIPIGYASGVTVETILRAGFVWRTFRLETGAVGPGHRHYYDHIQIVHRGFLRLTVDGKRFDLDAREMPVFVNVAAEKVHAPECVEGPVFFTCQFRWRDEWGRFVEEIERRHWTSDAAKIEALYDRVAHAACGGCTGCS